jgi:hypothetical protein
VALVGLEDEHRGRDRIEVEHAEAETAGAGGVAGAGDFVVEEEEREVVEATWSTAPRRRSLRRGGRGPALDDGTAPVVASLAKSELDV